MPDLDLVPLSDKLFLVTAPNQGRFPFSYSFLIKGENTALIDTGCGLDLCRALRDEFAIDAVYNSHAHPDHISGNFIFKGIDLLVPDVLSEQTGTLDILAARLMKGNLEVADFWKGFVKKFTGIQDYEATGVFSDGEVLDFGGITLQAIHCPGHLADHFCFWEPENKILMSFDIDMTSFGPFYGNPEADINDFRESMDKIIALEPEVVASSHKPPVTENAVQALIEFKSLLDRNEKAVLDALDSPKSFEEILAEKPLYKKYFPGGELLYAFFEGNMISSHLDELQSQGRVALVDGKYQKI